MSVAGLGLDQARARLPGEATVKTCALIAALVLATAALAPAAALAGEERTGERRAFDVDIDLKLGADGFRLGGRVFGPAGVWGTWVNGRLRRDGFTIDGRVQDPDRATNFRLNVDVWEWLVRGRPPLAL